MERWKVRDGMNVQTSDGEKLGKVIQCQEDSFLVEGGFFFVKDYTLPYTSVATVGDDTVVLAFTLDQVKRQDYLTQTAADNASVSAGMDDDLLSGSRASAERTSFADRPVADTSVTDVPGRRDRDITASSDLDDTRYVERTDATVAASTDMDDDLRYRDRTDTTVAASADLGDTRRSTLTGDRDEIRVPVVEEEVSADTVVREAGEVRVRKNVVTETQHISVPVSHEEVEVERVPVNREASAEDLAARGEETISVPLRAEEVEIHKRPVVKEEVHIRKRVETEQQEADTTVRRETVSVEEEGRNKDKIPPKKRPDTRPDVRP